MCKFPILTKRSASWAVYRRDPEHDIADAVLYSLLRGRALQEFNGEGWLGVHPLVVDILNQQSISSRKILVEPNKWNQGPFRE